MGINIYIASNIIIAIYSVIWVIDSSRLLLVGENMRLVWKVVRAF